jgi:hypothetical protein
MTQLTNRDLHVDQLLTNMSIAYTNPDYIADQIFPIVPVNKQSDIVPKYDQSHWFRSLAEKRAPGTKSKGSGFTVDTSDKYFCDRYSFRDEIPDETRDNADAPFNLDVDSTEFVTDKTIMAREVNFVSDFMKTGVWGTDKVGATDFTKFSDYGGSSPLEVITDYRDTVQGKVGRDVNTFVASRLVHSKLKWHPDLIDMIKYTQRGQLTAELIAQLLEFERYLIGQAIQTTDPEGTAEASVSYSRIWGKDALMLYVPARPSLKTPAAGYTFVWQRVANALQYIKRMRDEEREVDIIESNSYFDQKVTAKNSALFMDEVVA